MRLHHQLLEFFYPKSHPRKNSRNTLLYPIKNKQNDTLSKFLLSISSKKLEDLECEIWGVENEYLQHHQSLEEINSYIGVDLFTNDKFGLERLLDVKVEKIWKVLESYGYQIDENPYCPIYDNWEFQNWELQQC